jgi:hypothetical protein
MKNAILTVCWIMLIDLLTGIPLVSTGAVIAVTCVITRTIADIVTGNVTDAE